MSCVGLCGNVPQDPTKDRHVHLKHPNRPPNGKHPPGQITLLRLPTVLKCRGRSRSSHYADIKAGLFVKPVLIGLRATGTPDNEVEALNAARIAGKTDEEIRALVVKLEAARKTADQQPLPKGGA